MIIKDTVETLLPTDSFLSLNINSKVHQRKILVDFMVIFISCKLVASQSHYETAVSDFAISLHM